MKIIAIRIKNLASLEGLTEINFTQEPLCSAGIFAITGATGAGKSTILDALCLALYGKTPRYLQARETGVEVLDVQGTTISQNDVRGILRDGTAEGFAEVDFVGVDNHNYRANWSVRRARNKAEGTMQADSVTLKDLTSNLDLPGRKAETYKKIEQLVGLNFEQFTRSVLLAQGDFTAFLKANKDDKSSLLEKLTGTHIYSELSKKIYEKSKHEEQQLRDLNFRREGITTLSQDELTALQKEQVVLQEQIKALEADIEVVAKEIAWHEQLSQLEIKLSESRIVLQQSLDAKTNAEGRRQQLHKVERIQQTRSWWDALKRAKQQYTVKTTELEVLKKTIANDVLQKEELNNLIVISENNLAVKNKSYADAVPYIEQAKKLDTVLLEKSEQLTNSQQEAQEAQDKSEQHQNVLQEKKAELEQILADIKVLEDWKVTHTDRKAIAENKDVILSKLQDAQKLLDSLQLCATGLTSLEHKLTAKDNENKSLDAQIVTVQAQWNELKKSGDAQLKALLLIPIERLDLEKAETDVAIQNTIQAQAHWDLLFSLTNDYNVVKEKQQKDKANLLVNEEALQQLSERLITENTQKETSYKLFEKARLAATKNVEFLRATLTDHEPCPVCGSTEHPYAVHNPQLESVLTVLEKAYLEIERAYLATLGKHSALKQEGHSLKETIQRQGEEIISRKAIVEAKQREWEAFKIAKETGDIINERKAEWIVSKLNALKEEQANLQNQILEHGSLKRQADAGKIKLDGLNDSILSLTGQIKDNNSNIALYLEQKNGMLKEQETATRGLNEVKDFLSPYFIAADWMDNWKAASVPFIDSIHVFAKKWKDNTALLEQSKRQEDINAATLKELESQAKTLFAEAAKKVELYAAQDAAFKVLMTQRHAIFDGRDTIDVETEFKKAIDEALQQLNAHKELQQQLSINSTKAITQKARVINEVASLQTEIDTTTQKVQDWIEGDNKNYEQHLTVNDLADMLQLDSSWIDTERAVLHQIDEQVTIATSVSNERSGLLDIHKVKANSNRQLPEITALHTSYKVGLEGSKQTKNEIGFKLQQDESNKSKIGDLLKDILKQAAITEDWSKLNDIIGSADGKKFRQIAQEYTLDVLLGYANIHLQVLTSRYKIQRIQGSLGLQVIDHDMGEETRTVYSLSGGESFLVSLALALGLASLSSSKMKVESLFIDEGFGSLDPNTLNVAMDALERLHNQGRKVGVISHVQEMTERIPVQIRVSKQQSGKSKVEVLGL